MLDAIHLRTLDLDRIHLGGALSGAGLTYLGSVHRFGRASTSFLTIKTDDFYSRRCLAQ